MTAMASTTEVLAELTRLQPPKLSQSVHREECTQCFDNQDSPLGIDVCLTCFNGGCLGAERHHARDHFQKTGHRFALNIKRKLKPSSNRTEDKEPPAKMTKLAIVEDREEDKYDHVTAVKDWKSDPQNGAIIADASADASVKTLVGSVLTAMSSARQSEVKAWEEEILPCEHTLTLEQHATGPILASGLAHCSKCDLKENLWLCLTCGSLGCGRKQFGGVGGNGHGLIHYEETGHPVSVKLGTITPEGGADIYCYTHNDSQLDPNLASHLANFGINVQTQSKTEKSMTELQIEHNLKFDFSLTDESGKALEPVFGPGLTGLNNLGNSCYMASVLQAVFSLPPFQRRYFSTAQKHWESCTESLPATCVDCQMHKIADGLLSGRYSIPRAHGDSKPIEGLQHDAPTPVFQEGIRPAMFKALIGKGHEEFATMRQQDSEEFFTHLLTVLRRDAQAHLPRQEGDPTQIFAFEVEQRLQCGECQGVRYRQDRQDVFSVPVPAREAGKDAEGKTLYEPVQIGECLDISTGVEQLQYKCPKCQKDVLATKQTKFATFPETLVIHSRKFQLVNWVPSKLDIPITFPSDVLSLDRYAGMGLQPGETKLPEDSPAAPQFNEVAIEQLEAMGFSKNRSQKALLATGNDNAEAAMEWLFAHMDDPDIDTPILASTSASSNIPEPSSDQISMLSDMGFTALQARKALRETGGDPERAVEWLFSHPDDTGEETLVAAPAPSQTETAGSRELPANFRLKAFISHKGPSVHSGHYVAHIRVDEQWILFNDEKVVKADKESVEQLKGLAYLYVFEKV